MLTFGFGQDFAILKMEIFNTVDYIDIKSELTLGVKRKIIKIKWFKFVGFRLILPDLGHFLRLCVTYYPVGSSLKP